MQKRKQQKKIGRYTLLGPIGRGGMSIVYRAIAGEAEEIVALKLLYPMQPLADLLGMEKVKSIFRAEARKMADFGHPHIVKVLDLALEGTTPYYTMEYHCINIGMMINERFIMEEKTRIITPEKVLDYGAQILEGLRFIHDAGVVHRDIKPHNILVTDMDTAKICDFGMAIQEDEEIIDSSNVKVGSPYYIAPEQDKNPENADQRSDLYSVGVMLYRMLTGDLPEQNGVRLDRINPMYKKGWTGFFEKGLAQNPETRFQNADEMAAALKNIELHLEKQLDTTCQSIRNQQSDVAATGMKIRARPIRASGRNAREAFSVNELWQPEQYTENNFSGRTEETIVDRATGLTWLRIGNGFPVDRTMADDVIKDLNNTKKGGISSWRLPTVNELLTLVNDPQLPESSCPKDIFQEDNHWYWSCDRRSESSSWYVNNRVGYVGWQDDSCRNSICPVASRIPSISCSPPE